MTLKRLFYFLATGISLTLYPFILLRNFLRPRSKLRILVYHRVCHMPDEKEVEYWNVKPEAFEKQMTYLAEKNYHVMTIKEIIGLLQSGKAFPLKGIGITFDDGYQNNYSQALPALLQHGFSASFYIVTNCMNSDKPFRWVKIHEKDEEVIANNPSSWRPLKWQEILDMKKQHMDIGSHSHTHPDLSQLNPEELLHEITESKRQITEKIGEDKISFTCPFGIERRDAHRLGMLIKTAGYDGAILGRQGAVTPQTDPFDLPRITIYERDSLAIFRLKVSGAYDWMGSDSLRSLWKSLSSAFKVQRHARPIQ